jgi:hypothetical protein
MTATEILQDPWFLKGFKAVKHLECRNLDMDDVDVFDASNVRFTHLVSLNLVENGIVGHLLFYQYIFLQATLVTEERVSKPTILNAFELISLNKGLDLSGFFEDIVVCVFYNLYLMNR